MPREPIFETLGSSKCFPFFHRWTRIGAPAGRWTPSVRYALYQCRRCQHGLAVPNGYMPFLGTTLVVRGG